MWPYALLILLLLAEKPAFAEDSRTPDQPVVVAASEEAAKEQARTDVASRSIMVVGDKEIVRIVGNYETGKTLSGTILLVAPTKDVEAFSFYPSELTQDADPDETKSRPLSAIDGHNVSLGGATELEKGVPKAFRITVGALPGPGTYKGKLRFLAKPQSLDEALTVDLIVVALATPDVDLFESRKSLEGDFVNCSNAVACYVARRLLPASAFDKTREIPLDNRTAVNVIIEDVAVVVQGEHTGAQLTESNLDAREVSNSLVARRIGDFVVNVDRSAIPPDHFKGAVILSLKAKGGNTERLSIPVDINMRTGPLLPLLFLLIGVLVGRLVKFMQERGGPQAKALRDLNRLHHDVGIAHKDDRQLLQGQVAVLQLQIYREQLEKVADSIKAIRNRLTILRDVRRFEVYLDGCAPGSSVDAIKDHIQAVRVRIDQQSDVGDLMEKIKTAIVALAKEEERVAVSKGVAAEGRADRRSPLGVPPESFETSPQDEPRERGAGHAGMRDFLAKLTSRSDAFRAEATLWLARPLLYLFLMTVMVVVGLNAFYVEKGATFGAHPIGDYLSLLLWGLSADIAGRTLSNVGAWKPS